MPYHLATAPPYDGRDEITVKPLTFIRVGIVVVLLSWAKRLSSAPVFFPRLRDGRITISEHASPQCCLFSYFLHIACHVRKWLQVLTGIGLVSLVLYGLLVVLHALSAELLQMQPQPFNTVFNIYVYFKVNSDVYFDG